MDSANIPVDPSSAETGKRHQPNENEVRKKAPLHAARRTHKGLAKLQCNVLLKITVNAAEP